MSARISAAYSALIGSPAAEPKPRPAIQYNSKGVGMTAIVDPDGKLAGVFTDGDLRRSLDSAVDVHSTRIEQVMTENGKTVRSGVLAAEAVHLLDAHKITALIVVDEDGKVIGALNVHDLLRAGIM